MKSQDEINRLVEFVTAQANVMLAQYNNFNRLLGKTNDHTHTGNLCEDLLKECLRASLPKRFSVDKVFYSVTGPRPSA